MWRLQGQYKDETFVHVLPKGQVPHTRHVRGSNHNLIAVFPDRLPGRAIVISGARCCDWPAQSSGPGRHVFYMPKRITNAMVDGAFHAGPALLQDQHWQGRNGWPIECRRGTDW